MEPDNKGPSQYRGDRIEWFTVRYRTLVVGGVALAVAAAFAAWFFFLRGGPAPPPPPQTVQTGARFTSIEGSVQVKHAGSLEWVEATAAVVLRRNDLVRTGTGSTAEILFTDGTQFSVRPDGLFTIEESSHDPVTRHQRVALSIQSGEANFQTAARTVPGETTISTPTVRTTAERETVGSIQVAEDGQTSSRGRAGPRRPAVSGSAWCRTRVSWSAPTGPPARRRPCRRCRSSPLPRTRPRSPILTRPVRSRC
jgi:hypothetical protein